MSITNEIKKHVISEMEMDLVGIADIKHFANEPDGYRPEQILPGAKAVIVYGKRMPDGGVQSAFRTFEDNNKIARASYGAFCADLASSFTIFFHTFNLAQHIERTFGRTTTPLPCGPLQCGYPLSTPLPGFVQPFHVTLPFNIEKAAYASGLGDYGWTGRLLTKEYGPRIQFGAVITCLELECDSPYDGEPLCKGESCQMCVKRCPTEAIPQFGSDTRKVSIGTNEKTIADIKVNRCVVAACALRKEFGAVADFVDSNDPTEEELIDAFAKKPINHFEGLDHYPKWKCDKCLVYCPSGDWDKRFLDRGLSKGQMEV